MAVLEIPEVAQILGGKKVLRCDLQNHLDLVALGARGISKSALVNLAAYLDLSLARMAELLSVSERTLQRYRALKPFGRTVSEQILHIAEVAARGTAVFEDRTNFLRWLNQPSAALANKTPLELLASRFGADMVLDELGRMEHGVFA